MVGGWFVEWAATRLAGVVNTQRPLVKPKAFHHKFSNPTFYTYTHTPICNCCVMLGIVIDYARYILLIV